MFSVGRLENLLEKNLLHQIKYNFFCKISTYLSATPPGLAFAAVVLQIMHASAVAQHLPVDSAD